ncbi:hypothetical protein JTE90_000213 [Oedothorax gibbosus]|uniref:USP domain-containing protein n=1 Tax=Oedothorax gibbosus TaxID=931172 RepID=A0AAV6VD40_9ARAC|nr:hypothetical protein JTE90_000213 [Oedothorax gibbosus]
MKSKTSHLLRSFEKAAILKFLATANVRQKSLSEVFLQEQPCPGSDARNILVQDNGVSIITPSLIPTMAPTPGPVPIGQIGTDSFLMTPRQNTTVTNKGLLNMPGQNNCFLNSAVQVLWHLDAFRRSFRELSGHSCMAESCIFCALKELFTQFQYSQESALPPDALRHALAKTFCDQRRFQMGFMDDAAECFENILLRIHVHIANQDVDDLCGNTYCIPHQKFAMTLVEQRMCQNCSASSEPLPFNQMVHYVTTSALCAKAMDIQQQDPNCTASNFFGKLLRLAGEMGEVRECPSGCGEKIQAKKTLMNYPEVVSIGLVWDSESPTLQHITDVFHSIGIYLQLQDMFHDVYDVKWANTTVHQLVGVVTYYGKHYSTFFYHTKLRVWIYFDDATVQEIGPSWDQVVEKCQRGRFQPLLLLFASPDTSSSISPSRDHSYNFAQSNVNNSSPVNQRQAVINQYQRFQNSKKLANMKPSYGLTIRGLDLYNNIPYTYNSHLPPPSSPSYNTSYSYSYSQESQFKQPQCQAPPPVYSNLQYLNAADMTKLNEVSLAASNQPLSRTKSFDKDAADFDAAKDSDSAYTEEDPECSDMYISRKAVESVLKHQKRHMSLCRSYSQSSVGNRNSSSSLESFDNALSGKVCLAKTPENPVARRDSGSWSSDRNSSSSNNSAENPFLTVVASKRLLLGLNKKNLLPDSNTSDHGYDSFSVSSSDSYPSVNGSPVKLEPRLTQIPEDWQPEEVTDLDKKLKLITEDTSGPPDCDKLCAEADLLLAKSHEKEKDGDLVMAALLSDSAAARARAAMEAPYNNSKSLVSAKMKHSTCVMRSSNLYRRLKDHEMDERRKQKSLTGHHSRQSSRDSTHSRHSRQNSKDGSSKASGKDSNPNSDDTENFGKNIEIYGTLPKKGSRKKNASTGSLKVKDDQVYKDFLDMQRKNTSLSNALNETMLKNVDLYKGRPDYSPKRKSLPAMEKGGKTIEVIVAKSPTRKKDTPPKSDGEATKKKVSKQPTQVPVTSDRNNKSIDFNSRDLLSPIPSPDKKPHKIKRKLMGGFMKRKNRSLPDLREDQVPTNPMDCFLDDAVISAPTVAQPNGKAKKIEPDGGTATVSRGFHQPLRAFVKKDFSQRPLLVKVSPPNIQPVIPKTKLIHALPSLNKKVEMTKPEISAKPSKIPFMTGLQKSEPNLPPIPPFRSADTKCTTKPSIPQKTSAIPVLSPQVSLSPIKRSPSPRENTEPCHNLTQHVNEQSSDKEDLPLPLNPFLAEIQAKRKQVLNKSLQKNESQNVVQQPSEGKELSMLPKLALQGEGTSWLKELQSKQQQFLNKPDVVQNGLPKPVINIPEQIPVKLTNFKVPEIVKEPNRTSTMNWKLHSENTSEAVSSPSIGSPSKAKTLSSVKDLASRFENVLIQPKDTFPPPPSENETPVSPKTNTLTFSLPPYPQDTIESRSNSNTSTLLNLTRVPATNTTEPTCTPPLKSALKARSDYTKDDSQPSPTFRIPAYSQETIESRNSSNTSIHPNLARVPSTNTTEPTSTPPLKSALKVRSDYNKEDSQQSTIKNSVSFVDNPPTKVIKSALKQTVQHSQTSNGSLRPMQPPDYATAMQRIELIRTSTSDSNFQQLEPDLAIPASETDGPKKKSGPKKTVTFSDEVVLVACAEYDEIDFSSNPLFERVYQQHKEAGKGEISILSNSFGGQDNAVSESSPPSGNCNLCNSKAATSPNNYCTDCEFYLSRFKA